MWPLALSGDSLTQTPSSSTLTSLLPPLQQYSLSLQCRSYFVVMHSIFWTLSIARHFWEVLRRNRKDDVIKLYCCFCDKIAQEKDSLKKGLFSSKFQVTILTVTEVHYCVGKSWWQELEITGNITTSSQEQREIDVYSACVQLCFSTYTQFRSPVLGSGATTHSGLEHLISISSIKTTHHWDSLPVWC